MFCEKKRLGLDSFYGASLQFADGGRSGCMLICRHRTCFGPVCSKPRCAATRSGDNKLSDPTYPRLAQQARITGDVDLMLTIQRDGSVESAVVVSGHPMLQQAALESAQRSQFECKGCGEAVTSYP